MSSTEEPEQVSAEDRAYFRALEDHFLQLRGKTTLLGPEDWMVARGWRHAGIPVELVRRVMEDLFVRQQQRKSRRGISSLRYFAAAVEVAWRESLEHAAGGAMPRPSDPGPPIATRLDRLARSLPGDLPAVASLRGRLARLRGDFDSVERDLMVLEGEVLDRAEENLEDSVRREILDRVERAMGRLAALGSTEELEETRHRLIRQALRSQLELPVFSLFAPEVMTESKDPDES